MGASEPWSELAALSVMMSIPGMVIFVTLQRSLLERMMFGAIDE
jgi:ABC-type glycerol-3-phosphate transport system permease component